MRLPEVAICLKEKGAVYSTESLSSPEAVEKFMKGQISDLASEELVYINLDAKLQPINFISFTGDISACRFDLKAILKSVLLSNAQYGMMFHNHPSGNDTPSREDLYVTEKTKELLKMLDVELLDHIIYGNNTVSLKREGLL